MGSVSFFRIACEGTRPGKQGLDLAALVSGTLSVRLWRMRSGELMLILCFRIGPPV